MLPIRQWLGGLRTAVVRLVAPRDLVPTDARTSGLTGASGDYGYYPARRARYALLTALADNTVYSSLHTWSHSLKTDFALSPDIRVEMNPFYRLVEFWGTHTYSGTRDPMSGDGKVRPSSIPIETANEELRPAISRVLDESEWDRFVSVYARTGAKLGDVGLYAVDDLGNGRSYILVIDPANIVEYVADPLGVCQRYAIEEWRPDPRDGASVDAYGNLARVIYREEGELLRDADNRPYACRFRTYLVDARTTPFDWGDSDGGDGRSTWEEPYPFVPLVLVSHTKVSASECFGQAEGMPLVPKVFGLDDLASRFEDQVGKMVDCGWLFAGVSKPLNDDDPFTTMTGGRSSLPTLYGGPEARAQALVSALNLADVDGHLDRKVADIEKDYPELRQDIENAAGDSSGVALRTAQQRIETKAQTRRAAYDAGLRCAITYAIRIGGIRGYGREFAPFTPALISADPSILTFRIGSRPVFRLAKLDELLCIEKEWAIYESMDRAGCPLPAAMRLRGEPEALIAMVDKAREEALSAGLPVGRAKQAPPNSDAAAKAIQAPGGASP